MRSSSHSPGIVLLRGWFDSLADADGKVKRDDLKAKLKSVNAELQGAFDEASTKEIGKAFKRLEADKFTFEEFAAAANLREAKHEEKAEVRRAVRGTLGADFQFMQDFIHHARKKFSEETRAAVTVQKYIRGFKVIHAHMHIFSKLV